MRGTQTTDEKLSDKCGCLLIENTTMMTSRILSFLKNMNPVINIHTLGITRSLKCPNLQIVDNVIVSGIM